MKIPLLKIGDLVPKLPIVQGGMGVGISLNNLASAVCSAGGIGVISGVEPGFYLPEYKTNKPLANKKALAEQIRLAQSKCPDGILGVNIMVALNNFEEMVATAVKEGINIIFSGAGLPLKLPALVKESLTKIVPIVSSGKAADVICKYWDTKYGRIPDAVVVEGPKAGGHLGFSLEQLKNEVEYSLEKIVKEVISVLKPFENKYRKAVPVIAAGGIFSGKDIAEMFSVGAMGVQMATRFVATHECDASDEFKKMYINAGKDDVVIIKSPVGMPGRAIRNDYLTGVEQGQRKPVRCMYNCLKTCKPKETPYCIADALICAQKGDFDNGFAFAGENVYKVNKISSVKEIIDEIVEELKQI
jgi:nitronate monooxygenase